MIFVFAARENRFDRDKETAPFGRLVPMALKMMLRRAADVKHKQGRSRASLERFVNRVDPRHRQGCNPERTERAGCAVQPNNKSSRLRAAMIQCRKIAARV
ncbi:hypothetical protein C7I55_12890 [Sphingomonas deserti]|uniref:Uncharacterized protein n=1 Tax=Allosphingosinicella deserti TaxID=2116704 RepID=A0A2P7QNI2_9SPHN|nr:hypothetical protein C7I55_12890 [Sphingomonas deserti]